MKQQKIKYIVRNIYTGETYENIAVSEIDAINHVHFNLYFGDGIWTEMDDYEAVPAVMQKYSKLGESLKPAISYLKETWGI